MTPVLAEFEVLERKYRVHKVPAFPKAAHVAKRLAPFVGALGAAMAPGKDESEDERKRAALVALTGAFAGMPDADHDFVLLTLLEAVTREEPQGLGWAPVASSGSIMAGDLELPTLYALAGFVFWHNLGPFTDALPSALKEQLRKASALFPG